MSSWLTLQEYSYQNGVSISTLRRKIKNEDIVYKLENGRYFLRANFNGNQEEEKNHYQKQLEQKEKELLNLKQEHEDLINLVHFLEAEKKELLTHIENEQAKASLF